MVSKYYQARIEREYTWFFVATLRAHEHLAFDRTLDKSSGLFEFFVPADRALFFEQLMNYYQSIGIVHNVQELPNRLLEPGSEL